MVLDSDAEDADDGRSSAVQTAEFRSRFQPPKPAEISHKRASASNVTAGNPTKKSCPGRSDHSGASFVSGISPKQRDSEFPNEYLAVEAGKLFCSCCREELGTKKSSITYHIRSGKHKKSKDKKKEKSEEAETIVDHLKRYVRDHHPVGENLPEETRLFRLRVTQCFLEAGIPLEKVKGNLRDLLEEGGQRLTSSSHLRECIPVIHGMYRKNLAKELEGHKLAIVFDGSTRLGEAFALVTRHVDEGFHIVQCLAALKCLQKSMCGDEVSGLLVDVLMEELHVPRRSVVAAMRDGASVNTVALRNMQQMFPLIFDVTCFSHTLDRVGVHFKIPNAVEFVNSWVSLFAHSFKARIAFRELTGMSPKLLSKTRWWSKWEVIKQIMELFPDVHGFIAAQQDMAPATVRKLLTMLDTPQLRALI